MKIAIDNATLIKRFFQGEDFLLANRELRFEKTFDEVQLLTSQGLLLAKGKFSANPANVVVRLQSDYWQLLHQQALTEGFIPLTLNQDHAAGKSFAQYDRYSIPAGYQLHCQAASNLWKSWWPNHRHLKLMDVLLLHERRWYPVKQMQCDNGMLYFKTWRGEQTVSRAEMVVWLDRNIQNHRKRITLSRNHGKSQVAPLKYPYHFDGPVDVPQIPTNLSQIVKGSKNKLQVQTSLGLIIIEGQNLSCKLVSTSAEAS